MRQIFLDTETTGKGPDHNIAQGHRVIELACIEVVDRQATGESFHAYFNPGRPVDQEALAIHGLDDAFLAKQIFFHEKVDLWLDWINEAQIVAHNAPFDVAFLDQELKLCPKQLKPLSNYVTVLDTLQMARDRHPGQRNSLDALCKRYHIDRSKRIHHSAQLDTQLLLEVYLVMTREQKSLLSQLDVSKNPDPPEGLGLPQSENNSSDQMFCSVICADVDEQKAHEALLKYIQDTAGKLLWSDE